MKTVDKIIEGLNKSGFSEKDYRLLEESAIESEGKPAPQKRLFDPPGEDAEAGTATEEIDPAEIRSMGQSDDIKENLKQLEETAKKEGRRYDEKIRSGDSDSSIAPEILSNMNIFYLKDTFKENVANLKLPAFYVKNTVNQFFSEEWRLLEKGDLLQNFSLPKQDVEIGFEDVEAEMAVIDIEKKKAGEYVPQQRKVSGYVQEQMTRYFGKIEEGKLRQLASLLQNEMGKMDYLSERDLTEYIGKVIKSHGLDKRPDLVNRAYFYAKRIKMHIELLADQTAEREFQTMLDKDELVCKPHFAFPAYISPTNGEGNISKNLYEKEGELNSFEKEAILEIANLENVEWWHRNLERGKGFFINGFINHYPDFIIKTKNGKIILMETKGGFLSSTESEKKIRLGEKWTNKAGSRFKYFMVFKEKAMRDAKTLAEVKKIVAQL